MFGLLWLVGLDDSFFMLGGTALICCAAFSMYSCCSCRVRNCLCCKRFLRMTGVDKFDDFELFMVVHSAQYVASTPNLKTFVRATAGAHQVATDEGKGIYQQPLSLFVEQGTDEVVVELLDTSSTVLAKLKFKVETDLVNSDEVVRQKTFAMKQKEKGVLNPRIKLSIRKDLSLEEEGLLSNIPTTNFETSLILQEQLEKVSAMQSTVTDRVTGEVSTKPVSELELLMRSCSGPLEMFGSWGSRDDIYLAVRGPPEQKKYVVGIWESQLQYERGAKAREDIEVLKVSSVQPDPGRAEVFLMNYVQSDRSKARTTLKRIDRSRDVWVEMFQLLISKVREEREAKKRARV